MYDGFLIMSISILSALISEFLCWFFVYRSESYNRLCKSIELLQRKVEKLKLDLPKGTTTNTKTSKDPISKKINSLESELDNKNRDLSVYKIKSAGLTMICVLSVLGILNNIFDGIIVAQLPFVPFNMMRSITQRGLIFNNISILTDTELSYCSMMFIYILSSITFKTSLQRITGLVTPTIVTSNSNPWSVPEESFEPTVSEPTASTAAVNSNKSKNPKKSK